MDHEMMAGEMLTGPSGTFIGHFGPGLVFLALGLWWITEVILKGSKDENQPIERRVVSRLNHSAFLVLGDNSSFVYSIA